MYSDKTTSYSKDKGEDEIAWLKKPMLSEGSTEIVMGWKDTVVGAESMAKQWCMLYVH